MSERSTLRFGHTNCSVDGGRGLTRDGRIKIGFATLVQQDWCQWQRLT